MVPVLVKDGPLTRLTVDKMTNAQLDEHLEGIRQRRMASFKEHQKTVDLMNKMKHGKVSAALEKKCNMLQKTLTQLDKVLVKAEKYVFEVQAYRLELEGMQHVI